MSQQEVYDYLGTRKGSWLSAKDLEQHLPFNRQNITVALRKLREREEVYHRKEKRRKVIQLVYKWRQVQV